MTDGRMIQIIDGAKPGEQIVVKGSLFIDRVATAADKGAVSRDRNNEGRWCP